MTVRRRILLPVLALMILLPVLSTLIFYLTAGNFARREAEDNLDALRAEVTELSAAYFSDDSAVITKEQNSEFLRKASQLVRRAKGDAQLLVYAAESKLVFPYDEPEDSEVYSLSDAVTPYLLEDADGMPLTLEAGGEDYLVSVSRLPGKSLRAQFIVVYCPVSRVGAWVADAAWLVFACSCALAMLLGLAVALIARSITRPVSRLNVAAHRVAAGEFDRIEEPFSTKELEELRLSVNEMSEALERSEEEKKVFFQNLSHELRTPLMSIGGYAQGIEEGVMTDPKAAADVILSESRRLTDLVDELLTLSRLDQGEAAETGPIIPVSVLTDALFRAEGLAGKKALACEVDPAFEKTEIPGDEALLGRILDNLLSNALRHGKTRVTASLAGTEKELVITVRDDGAGIDEKDLPHIFERGYKGKNGHFGLGLAIARTAADKCGWTIRAENAPDGGAVFTVILPR